MSFSPITVTDWLTLINNVATNPIYTYQPRLRSTVIRAQHQRPAQRRHDFGRQPERPAALPRAFHRQHALPRLPVGNEPPIRGRPRIDHLHRRPVRTWAPPASAISADNLAGRRRHPLFQCREQSLGPAHRQPDASHMDRESAWLFRNHGDHTRHQHVHDRPHSQRTALGYGGLAHAAVDRLHQHPRPRQRTFNGSFVTIQDAATNQASEAFTITINAGPTIGSLTQTAWTVNQGGFSGTMAITGGTIPDTIVGLRARPPACRRV